MFVFVVVDVFGFVVIVTVAEDNSLNLNKPSLNYFTIQAC